MVKGKLILGGLAALGLVAFASKAGAHSGTSAYSDAVNAMRVGDGAKLVDVANSKTFDANTAASLKGLATKMLAHTQGQGVPLLVTDSKVDPANNEWAARVFALEGDSGRLKCWADAYRSVYPAIAQALDAKVAAIKALDTPAPPDGSVAVTVVPPSPPAYTPPAVAPAQIPADIKQAATTAIPHGDVPAPPAPMPDPAPAAVDPGYARAANLINMLNLNPRPKEDRTMVKMFQQAENMKPDGFYGVDSALKLAQKYGLVPPLPRYFSKNAKTTAANKARYKTAILAIAAAAPADKQAAWIEASKVDYQ